MQKPCFAVVVEVLEGATGAAEATEERAAAGADEDEEAAAAATEEEEEEAAGIRVAVIFALPFAQVGSERIFARTASTVSLESNTNPKPTFDASVPTEQTFQLGFDIT